MQWISENLDTIIYIVLALIGLAELLVKLTPTENDDAIIKKIASIVSKLIDLFIPNLKKGGGVHNNNIIMKTRSGGGKKR